MEKEFSVLKGIHPGAVLKRELKKRNLNKSRFAISIGEYPQTLGAITNGKRDMNTALSLKIEQVLNMPEGYLMTLQIYHDIKNIKKNTGAIHKPNLSLIRPSLFWDTAIEKIDWQEQKSAVIKRIYQRGNDQEKGEIINFYGKETVDAVLERGSKEKHKL